MPDAFFASTSKKRKRATPNSIPKNNSRSAKFAKNATKQRKAQMRDEELDSDATHSNIDDADLKASDLDPGESDREEDVHETPAEKRLRLAKIYLEGVKEGLARGEGEYDAAEIDKDLISARLKEDVLEKAGKMHIFLAESLAIEEPRRLRIKGHRLAVTSAILSDDAEYLYMAGKEGGISSWEVASGKQLWYSPKLRSQLSITGQSKAKGKGKAREHELNGHTDEVLALALSGDGKYLASGGKDRIVGVWEARGESGVTQVGKKKANRPVWVKGFSGHRDSISALSFRKSTNMLYTASFDRTIKLFDLSPGVFGYVETLFGHQDAVTALDSLKGDTALSCGGRDRTCRFWKIADETQLVFRGGGAGKTAVRDILEGVLEEADEMVPDQSNQVKKGKGKGHRWVEGSVDCIAMVDENTFLSGGDSGIIALWSITKKKPAFTYSEAHGLEEIESSTEGLLRRPRWIMSIACLRYADLFASGSWDGSIRLWKMDPSLRSFSHVGNIPVRGLINSLQLLFMPKGWTRDDTWGQQATSDGGEITGLTDGLGPSLNGNTEKAPSSEDVREDEGILLVAGVGQEPRLGRWMRLNGEGIVNAAMVFALRKKR